MKVFSLAVFVLLTSFSSLSLAATESLAFLYANPGPYQVKQELGVWEDADRDNRQVPYKLYYPADRKGKTPIVIWSHGAGGSREGSAYLGNHLASHGFATLHLQHPGTDTSMLGDDGFGLGFLKKLRNRRQIGLRFGDPLFVVEQVKQLVNNGGANGLLDVSRIGSSGPETLPVFAGR